MRELWREFSRILRTHKIKAQKIRGLFWSIFREKIRASKKIFRANFVLQTCHPKKRGGSGHTVKGEESVSEKPRFPQKRVSTKLTFPTPIPGKSQCGGDFQLISHILGYFGFAIHGDIHTKGVRAKPLGIFCTIAHGIYAY